MIDSYDYTNRLYLSALTTGVTVAQAKLIAAAGVNLQGFTKIYKAK